MFIHYKDTNVHALPYITYKTKRFKNKKTGKVTVKQVLDLTQSPQDIKWLRPGWNEFPSNIWEQNKENPGIKAMIAKGMIEIFDPKKAGMKKGKTLGPDAEIHLTDLAEPAALKIAKQTWDRDLLQRWVDEETRHKVKRALLKQIEPLLPSEKSKDDDDGDDVA